MGGVEVEVARLPAHDGGVEGRQEGGPRLDRPDVGVVGQHPPRRAVVERHLDGLHVGQGPGHGRLGRPEPPLDVARRARPEGRQPAAHELGVAGGLVQALDRLAEPVLGPCPARLVEPPVAGVATAQRDALEAEVGEHPRGDRDRPVVRLVGVAADHAGELGHRRAQLGDAGRPDCEPLEHGRAGGVEPGLAVGGDARAHDRLRDPLALRGRDPGRRAAPRCGQQVAREDEQGPAHGELLHHGAVVVDRRVDVGRRQALGAGGDREVHGGGLGGVEDRHRAGDRLDAVETVGRRQRVAYADPVAALGVTGPAHQCCPSVAV